MLTALKLGSVLFEAAMKPSHLCLLDFVWGKGWERKQELPASAKD
jgi:hypothetical protein